MEVTINYGKINIGEAKRVAINLHRSKFEASNINHFLHNGGADFYTQEVLFSNDDGNEISITMFSDTKEDLLDPTKKVKEIKK